MGLTESRGPKSDKRVFKAPRQFTRLRELSRIHMTLVGDVVRVQSRIKSLYRSRGVMVSGLNVYSVRRRDDWQKKLCSSAQTRAARLYDHLDFLFAQKKHRTVQIVETAPGYRVLKDIFKGAAKTVITQRNKNPIYARYVLVLDGV